MKKWKEFFDLFYKVFEDNPQLRLGQAYYNVLFDIDPELAREINGTECDPFYRDDLIPAFLEKLGEKWKNE